MSISSTLLTATHATAQNPVGLVAEYNHVTYGPQTWMYVLAGEALVTGNVCVNKDTTAAFTVMKSSATTALASLPRILGVAQHAIGSGAYGWILVRGYGLVLAGASVTINTAVMPGTRVGSCIDFAANSEHCVFAFATAAISDQTTGVCLVKC